MVLPLMFVTPENSWLNEKEERFKKEFPQPRMIAKINDFH